MPNGFRRSAKVEVEYHRRFGDFCCVIGGCPVDARTPIPFIVRDARCMCTNPNAWERLRSGIRLRSCVRRRITTRFPRCAQQIPIGRAIRLRHFTRTWFLVANWLRLGRGVANDVRTRQSITFRHDQRVLRRRVLVEFNEHTCQWSDTHQFVAVFIGDDMPVPGLHGHEMDVVQYFPGATRHQQRRSLRIEHVQIVHRRLTGNCRRCGQQWPNETAQ